MTEQRMTEQRMTEQRMTEQRMTEQRSQLLGLTGFILAGFVFIAVGIRSGDVLTVVGSVLWIVSCVIWLVPLLRSPRL